jgi:hypothetical protein
LVCADGICYLVLLGEPMSDCQHEDNEWEDCEIHTEWICFKNLCLVCGIVIYQDCDPQTQVLNAIEVPEL